MPTLTPIAARRWSLGKLIAWLEYRERWQHDVHAIAGSSNQWGVAISHYSVLLAYVHAHEPAWYAKLPDEVRQPLMPLLLHSQILNTLKLIILKEPEHQPR